MRGTEFGVDRFVLDSRLGRFSRPHKIGDLETFNSNGSNSHSNSRKGNKKLMEKDVFGRGRGRD